MRRAVGVPVLLEGDDVAHASDVDRHREGVRFRDVRDGFQVAVPVRHREHLARAVGTSRLHRDRLRRRQGGIPAVQLEDGRNAVLEDAQDQYAAYGLDDMLFVRVGSHLSLSSRKP